MMNETFQLGPPQYFPTRLNDNTPQGNSAAHGNGNGCGVNPFLGDAANVNLVLNSAQARQAASSTAPLSSVLMLDRALRRNLSSMSASSVNTANNSSNVAAAVATVATLAQRMSSGGTGLPGTGLAASNVSSTNNVVPTLIPTPAAAPPRIVGQRSAESMASLAESTSSEEPLDVRMAAASRHGPESPIPPTSDASAANANAQAVVVTGPSELYRIIASPPQDEALDWDVVLERALSHPHEACFYDPNAGGHVYALHRLLRRTGERDDDDSSHESSSRGSRHSRRPPVEVVKAVMQACPRAVTRKQAVIDEDDLMMDGSNSSLGGAQANMNNMEWRAAQPNPLVRQGQAQQQNVLLNLPPIGEGGDPPQDQQDEDEGPQEGAQEDANNSEDHDDVRFEYPLAIACECEQDGEIVRLLASHLSQTQPVYRSEVFRSLDYASLPNSVVRILLEEYAGCVLERGMNSEATEGDDDDCPLEQVLFWWDDPDMMGMEEEILDYPDCRMREDLCDLWEKLRMMLYAATMGTMSGYDGSKESFQVLHHVLRIVSEGGVREVRFPNDFAHAVLLLAKFIQREKAGMFEERDETGSLPLHIAVSGEGLLRPENDVGAPENENSARGDAMDGVVQAGGGGLAGEDGVQRQDGVPPAPPVEAHRAGQQAEDDEDDDDDEEENDDVEGGDDHDIEETSTMPSDMAIIRLLLDQHPASIRLRDSQSGSLPVHLALQHNPRAVAAIGHFLDLHPRSVTMPDGNGRLPLHLALIRKSPTWERVLGLSPNSLGARDPVTGLLPFQLAAMSKLEEECKDKDTAVVKVAKGPQHQQHVSSPVNNAQEELDSLSMCFSLLRMSPCLASGLANVKQRRQSLIEQQIMLRCKPRVATLEEENVMLRRRVEELELKLLEMQMTSGGISGAASLTSSFTAVKPSLKKRKPSSSEYNR